MKVNITGFMRNMLRPRCGEMVAEFLGHLKELRNDSSKHGEFFDLYIFGDDTEYRAAKLDESVPKSLNKQMVGETPQIKPDCGNCLLCHECTYYCFPSGSCGYVARA